MTVNAKSAEDFVSDCQPDVCTMSLVFNKIRYMVQIPESIGHFIHGAPYYRDLRRPGFYLHVIKRLTPKVK